MARDIRDLFKDDNVSHETMPDNHQDRFLKKLNTALPETSKKQRFSWFNVAASIVAVMGLSIGANK